MPAAEREGGQSIGAHSGIGEGVQTSSSTEPSMAGAVSGALGRLSLLGGGAVAGIQRKGHGDGHNR